jgi:DNA-binding transcriptional regulator YdaS (Cro superfamily)
MAKSEQNRPQPARTIEQGRLALQRAIEQAGGQTALAKAIGIAKQSVRKWSLAPPERVLEIERISGVPRTALRPDIFVFDTNAVVTIIETKGPKDTNLAHLWRVKEAFVSALEAVEAEEIGMTAEGKERYIGVVNLPWIRPPNLSNESAYFSGSTRMSSTLFPSSPKKARSKARKRPTTSK